MDNIQSQSADYPSPNKDKNSGSVRIDDVFGNETEVKYDSSKDKKYEVPNQVDLSESLLAHDTNTSKSRVHQTAVKVNTQNKDHTVREDVNYFIDTSAAAPDQELIDTKRQLNDALRELKKQTERAEYLILLKILLRRGKALSKATLQKMTVLQFKSDTMTKKELTTG